MRKILTYLLFTLCAGMLSAREATFYSNRSWLADGHAVRVQVEQSGVYMVTYDQIKNWGLNPDKVGVLGYGGALLSQDFSTYRIDDLCPVAIYMETGADGQFNQGDYLLFYGQGSVSWNFNGSYFTRTRNHCSDYGYYFLSDAPDARLIMPQAEALTPTDYTDIDYFTACLLHEKEMVNLLDPLNGLNGGGREFYGEAINAGQSVSMSFSLPTPAVDAPMTCMVSAASTGKGNAKLNITCGGHTANITFGVIEANDKYTMALTGSRRLHNVETQTTPKVTLDFESANTVDVVYLNYIELNVPCRLHLSGNSLPFQLGELFGDRTYSRYCLTGADANTEVWNITQPDSICRVPTTRNGDTLFFFAYNEQLTRYVAVNTRRKDFLQPTFVETIKPQNLHGLRDIDYVIIAPEAFRSEAIRLAQAHHDKEGLTWAVVSDQEVYNEFSSGTPDVSAYRWLMKMLYDCASSPETRPKYLLLFGDGTFDNRKLLPRSGTPTLLTYQAVNSTIETKAYATDDYFAFLEDKDGMSGTYFSDPVGQMRIGVGRLPISTRTQAQQVTDKLINYMNDNHQGSWKQQLCFLADDGDSNMHTSAADQAAELVRQKNKNFIVNKVYLDAYQQEASAAGERYPLAYNRFTNLMHNGVLFMDYCGHGSPGNITNEMFLTRSDVESMSNTNLAFWMLATCGFAHFDKDELSAAELAVLNPNGGAIAVVSACRTVFANENNTINRYVCDTLFGHTTCCDYNMTLGDVMRIAKNRCGINSDNKMPYILFGDPAIRLNYPTSHEVVTTTLPDTLRALQEVTIDGYIINEQGDTADYFNGTVQLSVYDKEQIITTRDNDAVSAGRPPYPYTYADYPNLLFNGSSDVVNGLFSLTFRMPKDLRYNMGLGRLVYYAIDPDAGQEGIGYDHRFVVGGSDPMALLIKDTIGPELKLYMDNPAFKDGGKTGQKPHFYADVYDEYGINTVGSGIGHDLMMVLDNDNKQTFILNDYFTTVDGDYRRGQVSYAFSTLPEGQHSLTFRAWDMNNNSNTAALRFTVVKGLEPVLYSVTVFPNPCPAANTMSLRVSADRPDEQMTTVLSIYSLNGEKVLSETWTGERTLTFVPADKHLYHGIYVYHIQCSTPTTGSSVLTGKLIVQ